MRTISYDTVPVSYMASGMRRYIENGIEPGGFMRALLRNDLRGAVAAADAMNLVHIPHWVVWLENNLPGAAWGSDDRYTAWINGGGIAGSFGEEV
jgi:hypothetical protein